MIRSNLLLLLGLCLAALFFAPVETQAGPYEDIKGLLASAHSSATALSDLDKPGPINPIKRVIDVVHSHDHVTTLPVAEALQRARDALPLPQELIPVIPKRKGRFPRLAQSTHRIVDVHDINVVVPKDAAESIAAAHQAHRLAKQPDEYIVKGHKEFSLDTKVQSSGYEYPLVKRTSTPTRYTVNADLDGSNKARSGVTNADGTVSLDRDPVTFATHTASDLRAEARRLLQRAKKLQHKKTVDAARLRREIAAKHKLGVFEQKNENYEDEISRLRRVNARMNRLLEQMQGQHPQDTVEGSIARKRYYLRIYSSLKNDAISIIQAYALRTGHSIFDKVDPSIAPYLPANSLRAILSELTNPTRGRPDETPHDVISGRDAKQLRFYQKYYKAKRKGLPLPRNPRFAVTDEELMMRKKFNEKNYNRIVATGQGAFGQDRPIVTTGNKPIGRGPIHITVVNPTGMRKTRGTPFQVKLEKHKAKKKSGDLPPQP